MPKYGDVFQQNQERLDSDMDDVVDDEERDRQEKSTPTSRIVSCL
jgi:hypothetical protein